MEPNKNSKQEANKELLDSISHVWNHRLSFLKSVALKCTVELGISDAIKKHGKPMTLNELANSLSIHPNKVSSLHQLMRLLVHSKIYVIQFLATGKEAYDLTLNSELLINDHPVTLAPLCRIGQTSFSTDPSHHLALWFRNQDQSCESPFQIAQGMHIHKGMSNDTKFNDLFNQAMASDSQLIANLLLDNDEFEGLIHGVESLIDVGGGNGTMVKAIAKAYPKLNFIVFDQPYVANGLQVNETKNLTYVAGDMFQIIPSAQVILLKWILHNWSDENCIKILRKCKEAIPSRARERRKVADYRYGGWK